MISLSKMPSAKMGDALGVKVAIAKPPTSGTGHIQKNVVKIAVNGTRRIQKKSVKIVVNGLRNIQKNVVNLIVSGTRRIQKNVAKLDVSGKRNIQKLEENIVVNAAPRNSMSLVVTSPKKSGEICYLKRDTNACVAEKQKCYYSVTI